MRNKRNKHLGIEIDPELHYKLHYIAKYEGRSGNGQILYLVRQCIREFENREGVIPYEETEDKEFYIRKIEFIEEEKAILEQEIVSAHEYNNNDLRLPMHYFLDEQDLNFNKCFDVIAKNIIKVVTIESNRGIKVLY